MAEKKEKVVKTEAKVKARAAMFDVLRRPIISEKSAKLAETNGMAFEIDARATKTDVAKAIKAIYNVAPEKINILNVKGKVKTFRGKSKGTQKTVKKAYVTLPKDAKIEVAANA
ncbi:MAG: 50S ribosomal protein L23 [Alphaproteobacteria bacterium]|nr:50S ribosomal protein L23 [Alphaproteobacteria bacterium]